MMNDDFVQDQICFGCFSLFCLKQGLKHFVFLFRGDSENVTKFITMVWRLGAVTFAIWLTLL